MRGDVTMEKIVLIGWIPLQRLYLLESLIVIGIV